MEKYSFLYNYHIIVKFLTSLHKNTNHTTKYYGKTVAVSHLYLISSYWQYLSSQVVHGLLLILLINSQPHPQYLLAVLQNFLLGSDAALGTSRIRLPLATLDVDMHVEFPAVHGHLRLSQQSHRVV